MTVPAVGSSSLPEDAIKALATLFKVMYPVRSLHKTNFCMLVEERWFVHGKALAGSVEYVLNNPPYNIRRFQNE